MKGCGGVGAEQLLIIVSIAMMCIIFTVLYRFRKKPGFVFLMGLVGCRIVYAGAVILERNNGLFEEKIVFRLIQQTALTFMVPFFILFVYGLVQNKQLIAYRVQLAVHAVFIIWGVLLWTDSHFHFVYESLELADGRLVATRTLLASIFNLFCYSCLLICLYFVFNYMRTMRKNIRKPAMFVLLLSSLPLLLEIIRFYKPYWSFWIAPLSIFCGITGMMMLLITFRYKLFSIVPIAKDVVFDTFQEGMVIINNSGRVLDGNKKAVHFFKELGHPKLYDSEASDLLGRWPEWHELTNAEGSGSTVIEMRHNEERNVYRVNVYPLRSERRQRQGSVSLIFDITKERRQLEKIAQLNQMKDQLFTIVSHDIRSPLAMQFQLMEMLEEDLPQFSDDQQEIIMKLGEQIRNTLGMSNNLLEWFRSQREDIVLRPRIMELSDAVEECCQLLQISAEAKKLKLVNGVACETIVYADREVVLLVVRNLLSNAVKFSHAGGAVYIHAQTSGEMVILSVRDEGIGMAQPQLSRLFSENQLYSSAGTAGEKGAGLGLLVSKQFVQLSGESMWAESTVGEGSVFYFTMRGGTVYESGRSG